MMINTQLSSGEFFTCTFQAAFGYDVAWINSSLDKINDEATESLWCRAASVCCKVKLPIACHAFVVVEIPFEEENNSLN